MLPTIFTTCIPRDEISTGELSLDLFAAKLRSVVEGKAPLVYQDANAFFRNTFPTDGIKTLIREVFSRLAGKSTGSPVIRLETSFGVGKTHDQIALWHICKQGRSIAGLERFVDLDALPSCTVAVAAIDGKDLDPENGIYHADTGITTYTLWGEIAYQIGGVAGYQLLQGSDKSGIAPGTPVLERLVEGKPSVIVLDEIACYLRKAKAKQVGKNSNGSEQLVAFFFALMDLAAACDNLVFVYSLASTADTFAEETNDLQELLRASARQERVLSSSTDVEIYNIVKQRLFTSVDETAAKSAASAYLSSYRTTRSDLPDACKDASYVTAIEQSYPFHPELFNLLTKKIASIPNFQKTRGALRLFAQVVRYLWQHQDEFTDLTWIPLIHPHHIPVGISDEITNDLTTRLERSAMRQSIGADIYNPSGREAYAQIQDAEYLAAGKPPYSSWVGRTIFLHSLTQGTSAGIHRSELNLSLFTPKLELGFVDTVLAKLQSVAWYLDSDPITTISRFREEPSINKIITQEREQIGRTTAKDDLRDRRDSIFAKRAFNLVSAPDSPADVDDTPDNVVLCLIDFDEATVTECNSPPPSLVERIFNNTGSSGTFRKYRNRLLFLIPDKQQLERAIELAREHRAINNILTSQSRLEDLSESQQKELEKRKGIKDLEVRVALTNTYRHLFYPAQDPVKAQKGLLHYVLPAQDTGNIKGKNNQQDVILKALKDCEKIRQTETAKPFAPIYILQKVWSAGLESLSTKSLRDTFASKLELNILLEGEISLLRDTIRQGLQDGNWDLKVGDKLFIKTDAPLTFPPNIEFSDEMVLYHRGILQPPAPNEIELSAQLVANNARIKWKAKGALKVTLYQNNVLVDREFRPSDEYEISIDSIAMFKAIADYGNGETITKETRLVPPSLVSADKTDYRPEQIEIAQLSPLIELDGSINTVFTEFSDICSDRQVKGIESLELSVDRALDYRKLGVTLPQLSKLSLQIDQTVLIRTGEQFVKLEYQGKVRGFQSLFSTINNLLNAPDTEADVYLKVSLDISTEIEPQGAEIQEIKRSFDRNQVERLRLKATIVNKH
jgi:Protein of unknown function (DUF499)